MPAEGHYHETSDVLDVFAIVEHVPSASMLSQTP